MPVFFWSYYLWVRRNSYHTRPREVKKTPEQARAQNTFIAIPRRVCQIGFVSSNVMQTTSTKLCALNRRCGRRKIAG